MGEEGDRQQQVVEGVEGVLVELGRFWAWAWLEGIGRVYFRRFLLREGSGAAAGGEEAGGEAAAPGQAVLVWARRGSAGGDWRATRLQVLQTLSTLSAAGLGVVAVAATDHAFLDSPAFPQRVFAPAFAAAEPFDQLQGRRLHFLSIPNPKAGFKTRFAVAVHAETPSCATELAVSPPHWRGSANSLPLSLSTSHHPSLRHTASDAQIRTSASLREDAVHVEDAYVTYVRASHGYLRSRRLGIIKFDHSVLANHAALEMCAGVAASALIIPYCGSGDVHKPEWRALEVQPLEPLRLAEDVSSGRGSLVLSKRTYGMLRSDRQQRIFLPGWAGVNNALGEGWQVPQMADGPVHFLSMPNPKPCYSREPFALCAHPLRPDCRDGTECSLQHWLQGSCSLASGLPSSPSSPPSPLSAPSAPSSPLSSLSTHWLPSDSAPDWQRVKLALRVATALSTTEFVSILNRCPGLYHWAYFTDQPSPAAADVPSLLPELNVLRQARLL